MYRIREINIEGEFQSQAKTLTEAKSLLNIYLSLAITLRS
jgi:hypothetical protein